LCNKISISSKIKINGYLGVGLISLYRVLILSPGSVGLNVLINELLNYLANKTLIIDFPDPG
jgi:hypothetical protein